MWVFNGDLEFYLYFRYGGCKDNNFVEFVNFFYELVDFWLFDYVDVMEVVFDFDRYCEVGLVEDLVIIRILLLVVYGI